MRIVKLMAITICLVLIAAPLAAQEMMRKEMGLSDEQKAQLRELNHEWAKKEIQLSSVVKLAELDLHHAMRDYDTSAKDVINLAKKLAEAKTKMITARAEHHNKKRGVFTKEQWEKMHAMGHGREGHMKKEHGKHGMEMKKHGEHGMKMKHMER